MSFLKPALAALLIGTAGLTACSSQNEYQKPEHPIAQIESTTIQGEITYLERMSLPPGSTATVKLLNISKADAPSETLREMTIDMDGRSVPVSYEFTYSSMRLDPVMTYSVRAEIRGPNNELLFTTDTVYPIDNDNPNQTMDMIVLKKI